MSNEIEQAKIAREFFERIENGEKRVDVAKDLEYLAFNKWVETDRAAEIGQINSFYRWKPKKAKHPGGEYPEPCDSFGEAIGSDYLYAPSWVMSDGRFYASCLPVKFTNRSDITAASRSGFFNLDKGHAIEHARVLFTPNACGQDNSGNCHRLDCDGKTCAIAKDSDNDPS